MVQYKGWAISSGWVERDGARAFHATKGQLLVTATTQQAVCDRIDVWECDEDTEV